MNNSMLLITSEWGNKPTFKMLPVNQECPYLEAIYDVDSKVLAIVSKTSKPKFHMLPKVDDNGDVVKRKVIADGVAPYKQERKVMDTFHEYYITEPSDIDAFIALFAINAGKFDYKKFMLSPVVMTEQKPSIITV